MSNRFYSIFVLCCVLAGCVTKEIPPDAIYTISPEWESSRNQVEREEKNPLVIKVAPIHAIRALTGTEILYSDARYALNSYVYSRWSDAPVRLLQILIQVALEENGRLGAVTPPTSASKADLLLESTLFDFSHHIKENGTSDGVVRIRFYLVDNVTKIVIATKEFASRVPASSQDAQGAATALNKAATNVARKLISWLAVPGRF